MLSHLFLVFLPGTCAQSSNYTPETYAYFYLTTVVTGNVRSWKMTNVAYVKYINGQVYRTNALQCVTKRYRKNNKLISITDWPHICDHK